MFRGPTGRGGRNVRGRRRRFSSKTEGTNGYPVPATQALGELLAFVLRVAPHLCLRFRIKERGIEDVIQFNRFTKSDGRRRFG